MKVELFGMSQTFDLEGMVLLQRFRLGMQLVLEVCGHGRQGVMSRFDGFVKAEDVAPIAHAASGTTGGTFQTKIKATDLLKVMTFHGRMTFVGLVHLIQILDVVFVHARFLGQNCAEELFHNSNLFGIAFVGQTILEGRDEFHGEVCVLGVDGMILHGQEEEWTHGHP